MTPYREPDAARVAEQQAIEASIETGRACGWSMPADSEKEET